MAKFAKKTEATVKEDKVEKPAKAEKAVKLVKSDKKETAPKAEKKAAGPDTRKLTLVTKENPKREGSKAYATFELYKKAKTVQAFYDAGGKAADIAYDVKAGHIQVG